MLIVNVEHVCENYSYRWCCQLMQNFILKVQHSFTYTQAQRVGRWAMAHLIISSLNSLNWPWNKASYLYRSFLQLLAWLPTAELPFPMYSSSRATVEGNWGTLPGAPCVYWVARLKCTNKFTLISNLSSHINCCFKFNLRWSIVKNF